jgi:hypothetical protein
MPYTKLDAGIIFSTVWREPHTTVRVWIALLAMKDLHGEVHASLPGLADAARVSLPECETALATFRAPDEYSRTKDNAGRRIEDIDGGWFVLNHQKFRDIENTDDRKRKAAIRSKRYRERHAVTHDEALPPVTRVTVTRKSRQADADADADKINSRQCGQVDKSVDNRRRSSAGPKGPPNDSVLCRYCNGVNGKHEEFCQVGKTKH